MNNFNRSIILVEDNPLDLDLTLRAFKKRKLTNPIEVARDGEEALSMILNWGLDKALPVVILLDLKLPCVDGLEVLRQVKEQPRFKVIPVIILTSSSEDVDVERAYQLGANSYIVKPVDFDKFMEVTEHIDLYWTVINKPPV